MQTNYVDNSDLETLHRYQNRPDVCESFFTDKLLWSVAFSDGLALELIFCPISSSVATVLRIISINTFLSLVLAWSSLCLEINRKKGLDRETQGKIHD